MSSLSSMSLVILGVLGLVLVVLSLRALIVSRSSISEGASVQKDLDRLFSEISRGLRTLTSASRSGVHFSRQKQEDVGRLLAELQSRLRLLDDVIRQPYEAKASQVLADAARAGITLPPLETPLISGFPRR